MEIEKFKLAVLSHNEFTDDQVEKMFYEVNINDVQDIVEVVCILQRNRPKLFQKLEKAIQNRNSGFFVPDTHCHWALRNANRNQPECSQILFS